MASFDELLGATPSAGTAGRDVLWPTTLAYLARYKGDSRMHIESNLRIYLASCAEWRLELLVVRRAHVKMYVRWLQEVRRFRPSTVSRRLSVVAGFYCTCAIDAHPSPVATTADDPTSAHAASRHSPRPPTV